MINVMTTRQKFAAVLMAGFAAAVMGLAATAMPAYASNTPWNSNVTVTAYADDPTYADASQYINVTMTFAGDAPDVSWELDDDVTEEAYIQGYLQDNITIAGRTIAADTDGYTRLVSNVVVNEKTITFTIGPNQEGMTANYSGEFFIDANSSDSPAIAEEMGYAPVETLVSSGIEIASVSVTSSSATFEVTDRAQARSMNHILITDGTGETPIFAGTGTFSNGGITIHSHSFMTQDEADYAAAIVSAANAIDSTYSFTDNGDGTFTITNGGADCSNIKVFVYDCDYLNARHMSVGTIFEGELDEDGNPVIS